MNFLRALVSGDESGVDSVVFAGLLALGVFLGISVYAAVKEPASWNGITFATGAGAIIATKAASKTARDRWSQLPAQTTATTGDAK